MRLLEVIAHYVPDVPLHNLLKKKTKKNSGAMSTTSEEFKRKIKQTLECIGRGDLYLPPNRLKTTDEPYFSFGLTVFESSEDSDIGHIGGYRRLCLVLHNPVRIFHQASAEPTRIVADDTLQAIWTCVLTKFGIERVDQSTDKEAILRTVKEDDGANLRSCVGFFMPVSDVHLLFNKITDYIQQGVKTGDGFVHLNPCFIRLASESVDAVA